MVDEQQPEPVREDVPARAESREKRGLYGVLGVVALIVIVILVFLLLRSCANNEQGASSSGRKTIEDVVAAKPLDGVVSVWIAPTTTLDKALDAAGLTSSGRVDMGGGRYVISVPAGRETAYVTKLQTVDGVNDAGRVFSEAKSSK